MESLSAAACAVLATAPAAEKCRASRTAAAAWRQGTITTIGRSRPPDRPARPAQPALQPPRAMKKRSVHTPAGRIALLHALAHIELNAVDLAWDLIARFADRDLPPAFYDDWVRVADDEARHFAMLEDRLAALGASYGDLPAHDGLWEAAEQTAGSLLARLAIAPMVLEARGLDVTPATIAALEKVDDRESAGVLQQIYRDEIAHVAAGRRWFGWLCRWRGQSEVATFRALVARHFRGRLKPPFNDAARAQAGMQDAFYRDENRAFEGAGTGAPRRDRQASVN